jgi:hypothetical protein
MMPNKCTVIRDGQEQKVDALELVPGDLVRLYIGDRVPADIRVIETYDLKVSNCSTDESATAGTRHDVHWLHDGWHTHCPHLFDAHACLPSSFLAWLDMPHQLSCRRALP